jgi:hypothetical protein
MSKKLRRNKKHKTLVKIIDEGSIYSCYDEMAKQMNLKNWVYDNYDADNYTEIFEVLTGPIQHPLQKTILLYGIKSLTTKEELIISEEGLEFIKKKEVK